MIDEYEDDDADYRIHGDFLISDMLKDWSDEELDHLRERSQAQAMNILPQEEFLQYADWFYFEETPAHNRFIEFIRNKVNATPKKTAPPELLTAQVCALLRQWAPAQECFNILESANIKFDSLKEVKKASEFITQMYNHTRIWGNNGWTPNELRENSANEGPKRKIGRNEPCPCGSGKKYKNCCGSDKPTE
jgi:preprotein translocase subunit SecA